MPAEWPPPPPAPACNDIIWLVWHDIACYCSVFAVDRPQQCKAVNKRHCLFFKVSRHQIYFVYLWCLNDQKKCQGLQLNLCIWLIICLILTFTCRCIFTQLTVSLKCDYMALKDFFFLLPFFRKLWSVMQRFEHSWSEFSSEWTVESGAASPPHPKELVEVVWASD